MLRVLPDQASSALLQRIRKTAFTDTRDSCVGLDSHYGVGLIEQRIRIGWRVSPYSRDLQLGQRASTNLLFPQFRPEIDDIRNWQRQSHEAQQEMPTP